ncbi:MAG: hypothetical protein IKE24_12970 [Clostridia bacterium]|nr:hypothetical protein [Clostridia bacterium]
METCFNWVDDGLCFASSDDRHWIAVIRRAARDNPEDVTILAEPQDNDGCIYAKMPTNYIHVYKPRKKVDLTDEQRAEVVDRLKKNRP